MISWGSRDPLSLPAARSAKQSVPVWAITRHATAWAESWAPPSCSDAVTGASARIAMPASGDESSRRRPRRTVGRFVLTAIGLDGAVRA
jgi:hypothetical protein